MTTDTHAAERIARTYEERGDSAAREDIRAGNEPPTGEMADAEMVLQHLGLDDGGAESRMLLAEHGDEGHAVAVLARDSVMRGYYNRLAEHFRASR